MPFPNNPYMRSYAGYQPVPRATDYRPQPQQQRAPAPSPMMMPQQQQPSQPGMMPPIGPAMQLFGGGGASLGAGAVGTGSTATMAGGSLGMTGFGAGGAGSGMGALGGVGAGAGTAAGAGGAGAGAGGGLAAMGPIAGFAALIGGGKLLEERNSQSPVGRGLLSMLGPSISQMRADPKLAVTTAVGLPFLNGFIRNNKAASAKPEWAGFMGF